jgi:uncharacterized damage-inducible protein DinB
VALLAYDQWANRKVLDACRKLTSEQYVAEPAAGWLSVRWTICHIALATEFNLRTLAGDRDDRIPTEAELVTVDDVAQLLGASRTDEYGRGAGNPSVSDATAITPT